MDITGVDTKDIQPRLIIESDNNVYMIKGKIEGTECKFDVPVLETLDQGNKGKVYCEVIIQDEQYSKLWEDSFETISKIEVKVLENIQEEVKETKVKPTVNLTSIVEEVEIEEEVMEVITEEKVEIEEEKIDENSEIEENDLVEKIYKKGKETKEDVFSFDVFIKNKKSKK
tara:strand:- start:649 stop:1161 length:513 start_codon:yes stop_codon:yes gene_type:complete